MGKFRLDRLELVNFSSGKGPTVLFFVSLWTPCLRKQMRYDPTRGGSSTTTGLTLKNIPETRKSSPIQPPNPFFIALFFQNRFGQALLPRTKQRNIRTYLTRNFGQCSLDNQRTARDRKRWWKMPRFYWNTRNLVPWRWKGSWRGRGG